MNGPGEHGARRERVYRIGDLSVAVRSVELLLAEEREADYLPFVATSGDGRHDVNVELTLGVPALPPGSRLLFEGGESWSAHACGEELLILPGGPSPGRDWLARLAPDRRGIRVVCAPSLVSGEGAQRRLASPVHYPLDQILLSLALAGEALIVHAAGVVVRGRGLLLAGASGAGKTTIARLCAAAGLPVLSDDRVLVRRAPEGWLLFGTPWPGEGGFVENRGAPLRGVAFLAHGGPSRLERLKAAGQARGLLPLASIPWYDRQAAGRCLALAGRLAEDVPAYRLAFRPDGSAVAALEECDG